MADYIFIRKSRNALSSVLHVILNLALAVVSIGATIITGNCIIGIILVIISKWRVFAVNHRYWLLNIRSSLVDFIVGVGFVLLAYAAGTTLLPVHFLLMVLYALWLIIIKPKSSPAFTIVQALVALIVGGTAATIFAAITDSTVIVAACFLLGFAATHHVLVQNDSGDPFFISTICGLFFAEIGWLSHAWLIIYTIGNTGICVSQLSIVLAIVAFVFFKVHANLTEHNGKVRMSEVMLPILFSILVIAVLLISFSQPRFNIH